MTDVKLLARWNGWCDPCETERPLLLTEVGERGLRAWLHGISHEDRTLVLTCGVCGEWQLVPAEEDDPEVFQPGAVVEVAEVVEVAAVAEVTVVAELPEAADRATDETTHEASDVVDEVEADEAGYAAEIVELTPAAAAVVSPVTAQAPALRNVHIVLSAGRVHPASVTAISVPLPRPARESDADAALLALLHEGFDLVDVA